MVSPSRLKNMVRVALVPLLQLVIGLGLCYLLMQKFALDIHIREPGMVISVALTVSDHNSAYTYSFNLPPLMDPATQDNQQEST